MIFGIVTLVSLLVVFVSLGLVVVNLRRATLNMDRTHIHRQAINAYRRGDLAEGERLKKIADAMPVYDAWPSWGRRGR